MSRRPRFTLHILTLLLVAIALGLPLLWTAMGSLRPTSELLSGISLGQANWTFAHYETLFRELDFWRPMRNSLIVAGATTLLTVTFGAACAYALARLEFPGKRLVSAGVLVVAMFPQVSVVGPLYLLLREARLLDTYPGLILPYMTFAMPLAAWLLTATFRSIPRSLEQAAWLDGASPLRAALHVVLPLAWPGLVSTAIITFVYSWNEFLFALAFTVGPERQTLPVAIALLRGRYQIPWGQVLAAAVLAAVPVALLVLTFQRWIASRLGAQQE